MRVEPLILIRTSLPSRRRPYTQVLDTDRRSATSGTLSSFSISKIRGLLGREPASAPVSRNAVVLTKTYIMNICRS